MFKMTCKMENGRVVMTTLKRIGRPATAMDVAKRINEVAKVGVRALMPTVKATLMGGIKHGFIQRKNGRYFMNTSDPFFRLRPDRTKYTVTAKRGFKRRKHTPNRKTQMYKVPKLATKPRQKIKKSAKARIGTQRATVLNLPGVRRRNTAGRRQRAPLRKTPLRPRKIGLAAARKVKRTVRRPTKRRTTNGRRRIFRGLKNAYKYKAGRTRYRAVRIVRVPPGVKVIRY